MSRSSPSAAGAEPQLSVVLACPPGGDGPDGALDALRSGTRGVETEVLVTHPGDRRPRLSVAEGERVRRVEGPPGALVPELWGLGLRSSRGDAVAFTTSHVRVGDGWAGALLDALEGGAAGAGGPIRLARGAGLLARAVHLLRYSDFAGDRSPGAVEEVAGDNAAYRREPLERIGAAGGDGFWDVEVHRRLRACGEDLVWVPGAAVRMEETETLGAFMRQRFSHGRRFGRHRSRDLGTPVWRSLAAAPLVPAVMAGRALQRTGGRRGGWIRWLPAVPHLLVTASAWAAGEAFGALDTLAGRDGPKDGHGEER